MSGVTAPNAEPGLAERWAVRAGLAKAAPEHHAWLLADCAAPAASRNIQMAISLPTAVIVGAGFACVLALS